MQCHEEEAKSSAAASAVQVEHQEGTPGRLCLPQAGRSWKDLGKILERSWKDLGKIMKALVAGLGGGQWSFEILFLVHKFRTQMKNQCTLRPVNA